MGQVFKINKLILVIGVLLFSSVAYAKKSDSVLSTIFTSFAKGVLSEVSEHAGKETAKFYLTDSGTKQHKLNINSIEKSLSKIVFSWNDAVSKRDTRGLFNLYGYSVLYYGSKLSDDKCIEDKNNFYKKYPYFSQSIENVKYIKIASNLYKITFDKFVKMKKTQPRKNYPSYLVIDTSFSSPLIMVEGDKVTDKNLIKKYGL